MADYHDIDAAFVIVYLVDDSVVTNSDTAKAIVGAFQRNALPRSRIRRKIIDSFLNAPMGRLGNSAKGLARLWQQSGFQIEPRQLIESWQLVVSLAT